MRTITLRHKIVSSTFTLPIMAVVSVLLWMLPNVASVDLWLGLVVTGLNAYLIMELNNRNALLRIRSRMMSVTYLALMLACPALHEVSLSAVPALCLTLAYFVLFASYQQPRAEGYVFHAFLFLGIGSIVFPPLLVLALAYYICMLFQLRVFNWRTFVAGILGMGVPYWGKTAYGVWQNSLDTEFTYLEPWFEPQLPHYAQLNLNQWVTLGFVFALSLLAFIHFIRTAYNDKIRTRMLLYAVAVVEVFLAVGIALLPQFYDVQLRLFIANSALLIAHHYALGKGRFFDAWFYLNILLLVALGAFNYCEGFF